MDVRVQLLFGGQHRIAVGENAPHLAGRLLFADRAGYEGVGTGVPACRHACDRVHAIGGDDRYARRDLSQARNDAVLQRSHPTVVCTRMRAPSADLLEQDDLVDEQRLQAVGQDMTSASRRITLRL